jgi:hypothetical protein
MGAYREILIMKNIAIIALGIICVFLVFRGCKEKEPKVITKTVIEWKSDTITVVEISKPKIVYVERYINIKGKDSIIYRDKPTTNTTTANDYQTILLSNKAKANLNIVTTGQLIDVTGDIEYPEITNTITITKKVAKNGLFASVQSDPSFITFGGNLDLVLKNKIILGGGVLKVPENPNPYVTFKAGIKIF